jgi:hypothetical protein
MIARSPGVDRINLSKELKQSTLPIKRGLTY